MAYNDEKILLSKFYDKRRDYGWEVVESPKESIFLRVWSEGCCQHIEFEELMSIVKTINSRCEL